MTITSHDSVMSTADAQSAIMNRHSELRQLLSEWAGTLVSAVAHGAPIGRTASLLRAVLEDEVLPHARAEERTLYRAAARRPQTALLVQALISEHRAIAGHAARLAAETGASAAATAETISSLFAVHTAEEDDLLLPALARSGTSPGAMVARERNLAGTR